MSPTSSFIEPGKVHTANALRESSRLWSRALVGAGLVAGDRVVLAVPPGVGFLSVLSAALQLRLTLALVPSGSDLDEALDWFDARAVIGEGTRPSCWTPDSAGAPSASPPPLRAPNGPSTPDARLILASSGTTGAPRWVALSDANLHAVLSSHLPLLGLEGARVLSILPWTHAFGLIIDLLPALLAGGGVVRDPAGGRDPRSMADLLRRERITHLSGVPLAYRRLVEYTGDDSLLRQLRGGVVGGAAVTPSLAELLAGTHLRVGYGLTEASPGLSLGRPGEWVPYALGLPVGCQVRLSPAGVLEFQGPNACLGFWSDGSLQRLDPSRWVDTGDLVEIREEGLFHRGRSDDQFKLENGRWIREGECRERLRARFPFMDESLIFSPDGIHLALAWSGHHGFNEPSLVQFRDALGSPGALLRQAVRISEPDWPRTPKGAIDREAARNRLVELLHRIERETL